VVGALFEERCSCALFHIDVRWQDDTHNEKDSLYPLCGYHDTYVLGNSLNVSLNSEEEFID